MTSVPDVTSMKDEEVLQYVQEHPYGQTTRVFKSTGAMGAETEAKNHPIITGGSGGRSGLSWRLGIIPIPTRYYNKMDKRESAIFQKAWKLREDRRSKYYHSDDKFSKEEMRTQLSSKHRKLLKLHGTLKKGLLRKSNKIGIPNMEETIMKQHSEQTEYLCKELETCTKDLNDALGALNQLLMSEHPLFEITNLHDLVRIRYLVERTVLDLIRALAIAWVRLNDSESEIKRLEGICGDQQRSKLFAAFMTARGTVTPVLTTSAVARPKRDWTSNIVDASAALEWLFVDCCPVPFHWTGAEENFVKAQLFTSRDHMYDPQPLTKDTETFLLRCIELNYIIRSRDPVFTKSMTGFMQLMKIWNMMMYR